MKIIDLDFILASKDSIKIIQNKGDHKFFQNGFLEVDMTNHLTKLRRLESKSFNYQERYVSQALYQNV